MYDENLSYEEVLKEAQELGFAEANPESDVQGYDAARKLSILSTLAYDRRVYWKDFYLEGISNIDRKDIYYAKKLGCKIKLVGQSKLNDKKVSGFVRPVLVDNNSLLSRIDNEYNIVVFNVDSVGEVSFVGKGAGRDRQFYCCGGVWDTGGQFGWGGTVGEGFYWLWGEKKHVKCGDFNKKWGENRLDDKSILLCNLSKYVIIMYVFESMYKAKVGRLCNI